MADEYFQEIESHFAARRQSVFVLSSKDWMLMKEWEAAGIPLPVVIEAIDSVWEKNESSGRKKSINSLHYCRHAVKELWEERKALTVGSGSSTPEESPQIVLEQMAAEVERVSPSKAAAIRALARQQSVPKIEEGLLELEGALIDELLATLPELEIAALRQEIREALGPPKKSNEKTRTRTEQATLRRLIRERFNLPRLSLF